MYYPKKFLNIDPYSLKKDVKLYTFNKSLKNLIKHHYTYCAEYKSILNSSG